MFIPPLPKTVTPSAKSGRILKLAPTSGMKKLVLPLSALASMPAWPEPVRDASRFGLNYVTPSCQLLSRNDIAPGFTAPPKGSCATATAAPPIPIDFRP